MPGDAELERFREAVDCRVVLERAGFYRAVQFQATGAEEMPATAAAAGRRSFPAKS